jgi:hypothetical protein
MTRAGLRVDERVILFARLSSVTVGECGMQYTEINDGSCPGCMGDADRMEDGDGGIVGVSKSESLVAHPSSLPLPSSLFTSKHLPFPASFGRQATTYHTRLASTLSTTLPSPITFLN